MKSVTMNDNITNDLATKLLAQENLMINRAPVRTASFDVKNRILTLPQWKDMTPELEDMLKAHEVGHAIYTDTAQFDALVKANKDIPFGYINVIEDVRIERLMKKAYPGLRRVFNVGYRQIAERDFFELKGRDVNSLILIDRINVHSKVGLPAGVRFTVAEKYLLEKIERNESLADVIVLARAVLEMTKRDQERKKFIRENDSDFAKMLAEAIEIEEPETMFDDHDWDQGGPIDEEDDEEEEGVGRGAGDVATFGDKETSAPQEEQEVEADIYTSATASALERQLEESADTNTTYMYLNLPDTNQPFFSDVKVDYKTVLKETTILMSAASKTYDASYARFDKEFDDFRSETNRVVSYLIKEFEMKKAATAYKRQHISKTGVLDTAKLASYKIREDIFRQVTITKDGQKHGMVFTIDWSGSMDGYLLETMKQLISLVTFCYRAKIPFEVYAFSDQNGHLSYEQRIANKVDYSAKANTLSMRDQKFSMFQFFSHKMTLSEFNRMCRNLFIMSSSNLMRDGDRCDCPISIRYQLNGTPLNQAMVWLYNYVGEFKRVNQVEKLTVIKLTDGDGCGLNCYYDENMNEQYINRSGYSYVSRTRTVTYLRDTTTQKVYRFDYDQITNTLCKMIEDRHDCAVVGYHVTGRGRRELTYHLDRYGVDNAQHYDLAVAIRKGFNDEQFYSLPTYGHTEMFMLPNNIKVEDGDLGQSLAELSAGQIAKKFGKMMGGKKTSRVLLNKFVAAVA
jgi:hypothetical protein